MAANFRESVEQIKSPESRASDIESAIRHHITVNLDEDPEYYKSLSLRLRDIIEKTAGKWEQQLELLLHMTSTISTAHQQAATNLGLTQTEYAFYNTLMAVCVEHAENDIVSDDMHDEIKSTTQTLVAMFDEATDIVDFFLKPDEVRRMKREIKRAILGCSFGNRALITTVQDRFMELAQTKFG